MLCESHLASQLAENNNNFQAQNLIHDFITRGLEWPENHFLFSTPFGPSGGEIGHAPSPCSCLFYGITMAIESVTIDEMKSH